MIDDVTHRGGVPWWKAPLPPADHKCKAQTSGWFGPAGLDVIERCACGAGRWNGYLGRPWIDRNSRTAERAAVPPVTPASGEETPAERRYARVVLGAHRYSIAVLILGVVVGTLGGVAAAVVLAGWVAGHAAAAAGMAALGLGVSGVALAVLGVAGIESPRGHR